VVAVLHGTEERQHGHDGLARPHVALHQAPHAPGRRQVRVDRLHRNLLTPHTTQNTQYTQHSTDR
jgi:hypothetical protein